MKKRNKFLKKVLTAAKKNRRRTVFSIVIASLFLLSFAFYFLILRDLPSPKKINSDTAFSTAIYDRHGEAIYEIYIDKNRISTDLEKLPDYVKQATLAIEDQEFYDHHGFSVRGIVRAVYSIIFRRNLQGGSTITQQLVKNALLSPERTIKRKIKEAILTVATEIIYSKDQILEMYFNQTPYGGTAWGIEAAARKYFNKSSQELSLAEAALLAGLPASPTTYSPFGPHPELAENRQAIVLNEMVSSGFIDKEEAKKAKEEKLVYAPMNKTMKAPHFAMFVKEKLVAMFGQKKVEQGGLQVTTTLDLAIQKEAQKLVADEIEKIKEQNVTNGAAVVTNPGTGEILAMVGSRNYFDQEIDGNFNVTTARRQPGSSIKPLNYSSALDQGIITAATPLIDAPTQFVQTGVKTYRPVNYDRSYHGVVQVRFALANSYNIPAVKVLTLNGLENFMTYARRFGITTFGEAKNYGLSLTLGGGEVKMIDMATAFGSLANLGVRKDLVAILEVKDNDGKALLDNKKGLGQLGKRVVSKEAAYITSHILLDNGARSAAFGFHSHLVIKDHPEVSVKTGTSNDMRDNWTIGYTPSRLVTVWVGNNDNSSMGRVVSGLVGASPIWNEIMSYVLRAGDFAEEWPSKPENVIGVSVCNVSGQRPGDSGCPTRFEYFIKDYLPGEEKERRETIPVNKETNEYWPAPKEGEENIEMQEHPVIKDSLGAVFCLDCAPQKRFFSVYYPLEKEK